MREKRKRIDARKKKIAQFENSFRLNPDMRLCPMFDSAGNPIFPVPSLDEMDARVLDDIVQEHIQ